MKIEKWNIKRDGPLSEDALRQKLEKMGYEVTRYIYPPGTFFPNHAHTVDKIDAVLSGRFRMSALGQEVILEAGDYLTVPKGVMHSAEVIGSQPVVSLDATREVEEEI